jgi:hypothetical protein
LHAIWNIKTRLLRHGGVASPRDTCGYRCGLRLALTQNPSFLFVPPSVQHYTSSKTKKGIAGKRESPQIGFSPHEL